MADEPCEDNAEDKAVTKKEDLSSIPADVRKARRRMAYIALVSMNLVMLLIMFKVAPERLKIISEPIVWFFFVNGSIVGAYLGFSTVFDAKINKGK